VRRAATIAFLAALVVMFTAASTRVIPVPIIFRTIALEEHPPIVGAPDFFTDFEDIKPFRTQTHALFGTYGGHDGQTGKMVVFGHLPTQQLIIGVSPIRHIYDGIAGNELTNGQVVGFRFDGYRDLCRVLRPLFSSRYGPPEVDVKTAWEGYFTELSQGPALPCSFTWTTNSPDLPPPGLFPDRTKENGTSFFEIPPEIRPTYVRTWHHSGRQAFIQATVSDMDRAVEAADLPSPWREHLSRSLRTFVAQRQAWRRYEQSGMVAAWEATWRK
jgi:hypothetical protein